VKNTFEIGTGAISLSFSASSIAGSWLRPEKMCWKGSFSLAEGGELGVGVDERFDVAGGEIGQHGLNLLGYGSSLRLRAQGSSG
jgi:hypothetical protein